jgi:hypothetical protein
VLERVPGLPTAAVRYWNRELVGEGTHWEERIRTQRPTGSHGIVDLEIELRPSSQSRAEEASEEEPLADITRNVVCWVEIKHGAALGHDEGGVAQTAIYLEDIAGTLAGGTHVRLLVPRGFDSTGAGVPAGTWQEFARFLVDFRRREQRNLSEVSRWLIGEFLDYLKEEDLMDEERLTVQHAFVAAALPGTQSIITRVYEVIDAYLRREWSAPTAQRKGNLSNIWMNYPLDPRGSDFATTWGPRSWLEWGLRPDVFRDDEARRSLVFYSGLNATAKENPLIIPGNAPAVYALEAQGFQGVFSEYPRLWRLRYVEDVLALSTLEEQALALADWVLTSFRAVVAAAPAAEG